jgi:DNA-binding Xre family transcriptional regulator
MSGVHIGLLIKEQVKKKRFTVAQFAQFLNVSEANVYKIYHRSSIDTDLLERVCVVLDFNFFEVYYRRFSISSRDLQMSYILNENELLKSLLQEKEEKYKLLSQGLSKTEKDESS